MKVLALVALSIAPLLGAAEECSKIICPSNTECAERPLGCFGDVCIDFSCIEIGSREKACGSAECGEGEVCLPEPKECFTTPCPQYKCVSPQDFVCSTASCPAHTRCVFSPKTCFTTPCPQFDCESITDPCEEASCPPSKICVAEPKECFTTPCPQYACLDAQECPSMCPQEFDPVCGSDDHTYSNECALRAAMCESKRSIYISHKGECQKDEQACPTICPADYTPVCGTDDMTYSNECTLHRAACRAKTVISVQHKGECSDCNMACTMEYAPVCASNGKTYSSQCNLAAEACRTKSTITVLHKGECEAACPEFCTMMYDPVCGSDYQTHGNPCLLSASACKAKSTITVLHKGECEEHECDKAAEVGCNSEEKVCGSDKQTYNECSFRRASCKSRGGLSLLHHGVCFGTGFDDLVGLDGNGDGVISKDEFASAHPENSAEDNDESFEKYDDNGDGHIGPDDFGRASSSAEGTRTGVAVGLGVITVLLGAVIIAGLVYRFAWKKEEKQYGHVHEQM